MTRLFLLALLALVLVVGAAACGGDDDDNAADTTATETTTEETTTGEETTTDTSTAAGKEVFVANCGSCHTLADAGTSGNVGPNLDTVGLAADEVESQVRSGGGGMPAFEDQLSDEEITEVAAYVAANDGS
jgi:mono/diheme cytochrome c family protein